MGRNEAYPLAADTTLTLKLEPYDLLVLADIYSLIAYYLRHRDEVRAYLKRRAE